MTGRLNRLTIRQVQTLTRVGRHADGGGLYLKIRSGGSRQWVFLFARIEGSRRVQTEIGLGSAGPGGVSLADARVKAEAHRRARVIGEDPVAKKREAEKAARAAGMTFGKFADEYVATHKAGWSNAKHASQWEMTRSARSTAKRSARSRSAKSMSRMSWPSWPLSGGRSPRRPAGFGCGWRRCSMPRR